MKNISMSFTAAGDMLVQRRLPENYEGFQEVSAFIKQGDWRYFNLETTINKGEGWANQYNGGSYLRADAGVLDDARKFGFNVLSFVNNHSLDFGHWGLLDTIEAVNKAGFPHAGCGENLSKAAAPAYLDTKHGRIALVAATSTLNEASMAGMQSRCFIGRPGVNGLRHKEIYQVTPDLFQKIKEIALATSINGFDDICRHEGYLPLLEEGTFPLGKLMFCEGDCTKRISIPNEEDMTRIEQSIYEAEFQADYIVVSIHSHEVQGTLKETPDDFLVEFCHRCIDAGADAVVGHGPHLLRPIEIYKGCPIFYSLGDFIIENENIPYAPEDMYEMYHMKSDALMRDVFKKRSGDFRRGLQKDRRAFETVIPYWTVKNGVLKQITLLPLELGFGEHRSMNGLPKPMKNAPFMEKLQDMSRKYGTEIVMRKDGLGEIVL